MSQGKQAPNGGGDPMAAAAGAGAPPVAENMQVNGAGAPPAASNGQGAPSGARRAPSGAGVATDGVADAHLGRALSVERRRQMSQGRQALTAGAGQTAAAAGVGAPPVAHDRQVNGAGAPPASSNGRGVQRAPSGAGVATDGVADAHLGRALSVERRRQLSQGKQALTSGAGQTAAAAGVGAPPPAGSTHGNGAGAPPTPSNGQGAPSGVKRAPSGAGVATDGVADAHLGRALSVERRRQLSQGKQALTAGAGQTAAAAGVGAPPPAQNGHVNGAGAPPAASNGQGARRAPSGAGVATDGVADAHLGRALSVERRRQLSQGKQALTAGAGQTAAAAGVGALPVVQDRHVNGAGSGPEQARARRADASRSGRAGISRPQREGRVTRPPKVVVSPTHGGQQVTGPGIGPGVRVTGDEAGAALPVSGSQYVPADGSPAVPDAGAKVGLVRTPQGLVVSGTTVRNKVAITGDERGEHLPITGEADQKLDDDLTPRSDGSYRPAQFPRRADPHGATA
ncbi:MAG: CsoS2 family carboxysome shell protein, partial [Actinomycetota bacterium]|nr:CsoS2 family carboxysome shell protein [Actinomycetota bacterium]